MIFTWCDVLRHQNSAVGPTGQELVIYYLCALIESHYLFQISQMLTLNFWQKIQEWQHLLEYFSNLSKIDLAQVEDLLTLQ